MSVPQHPFGRTWELAAGDRAEKSGRGGERPGEARRGGGWRGGWLREPGEKELSQKTVQTHQAPSSPSGRQQEEGPASERWKSREREWRSRPALPMAVDFYLHVRYWGKERFLKSSAVCIPINQSPEAHTPEIPGRPDHPVSIY